MLKNSHLLFLFVWVSIWVSNPVSKALGENTQIVRHLLSHQLPTFFQWEKTTHTHEKNNVYGEKVLLSKIDTLLFIEDVKNKVIGSVIRWRIDYIMKHSIYPSANESCWIDAEGRKSIVIEWLQRLLLSLETQTDFDYEDFRIYTEKKREECVVLLEK